VKTSRRRSSDRLLVAQALEEYLPILSCDEVLSQYGIEQLW
jgi:PIN domain nuclease of toxin-antitoxin system